VSFTFVATGNFQEGYWNFVLGCDVIDPAAEYTMTVTDTTTSTVLFTTSTFTFKFDAQGPTVVKTFCPFIACAGDTISVSFTEVSAGGSGCLVYFNYGTDPSGVRSYILTTMSPAGPTGPTGPTGGGGGSLGPDLVVSTIVANNSISMGNGNPPWVAVGGSLNPLYTIQTSQDGINWSPVVSGGFGIVGIGVAFNGSQYVAVGIDGMGSSPESTIKSSTDGLNWSSALSGGFDYAGFNVAYGNGVWVVAGGTNGDSTSTFQRSTDGINWSSVNPNGLSVGYGVAYNSNTGLWVAAGQAQGTPLSTLQWSTDGITWNSANAGGFAGYGGGNRVATSGSLWVATGMDPSSLNTIQWSADGSNWNSSITGGFYGSNESYSGYGVAYSPQQNLWVAVGNSSNDTRSTLQWSSDGSNWNPSQSGGFDMGNTFGSGVAYNATQNLWVATGFLSSATTSSILHSADGSNWFPATSGGFQDSMAGGIGLDVVANNSVGTLISPSSITSLALTISSINGIPPNTLPFGQGYTDTTTFQYNFMDPVNGFQTGVPLSNISTIGFVVNRPLAPINYFNIAYAGNNTTDIYAFLMSSATTTHGPYSFSTSSASSPDFYEVLVSSISTPTSQLLTMYLDPSVSGLTLYSLTLGYN